MGEIFWLKRHDDVCDCVRPQLTQCVECEGGKLVEQENHISVI